MEFQQVDPSTGEAGAGYESLDAAGMRRALQEADAAFHIWRTWSYERRAVVLRYAAEVLRAREGELADLMALEMGKPLTQGLAEVEKCAVTCEYYAERAATFLADETVATEAARSYVHYEPLGVVFAIMPWNFPLWQLFRFGAPALMAGNGIVLKHAPNVPGCALAIESVLREALESAGAPIALVANLFISVEQSAEVIAAREVKAVTLTGSTRAGRAVAASAGAALKKVVLELGGSDAYVVLADADVEAAASACVTGRMVNAGQSCVAAKRWIVVDEVRPAFEAAVRNALDTYVLGDPRADGVTVGPMARIDLRDELHGQVTRSVEAGARLVLGGEKPDKPGAWYPVTLLADVRPGMAAFDEELFGPVAAIVPAADEAEALALANQSDYGLGAAVFTSDLARGEEIAAKELDAGCCFVNTFVRSDPRLPFGGVKDSGYGRELGSHGIREFVNPKTVYVA
jgi:succinate-semialdehyde dehydrogenase/glutarate-semialdehyde dehydrogenase